MRQVHKVGSKLKELQRELWREVGIRLENEADVQMFRSTCKLWRSLVPSPFPCLLPLQIPIPPQYKEGRMDYYIAEHNCYLIKGDPLETKSTNPIFLVLESTPDRHAFYPFRLFECQPGNKSTWCRPLKLDLERLRTSLVYKAYYLHFWTDLNARKWGLGETYCFNKLVLFPYCTTSMNIISNNTPTNLRFLATEKGIDLVAVGLLREGDLAHLTININNPPAMEWKLVNHQPTKFDDIICYGGRLWGVDLNGGAFVIKINNASLSMTQVAAPPMIFKGGNLTPMHGRRRFVEASGRLYMLFPCRSLQHDRNQIMVYQLIRISKKEDKYEWEEIKSIGNKAFFVGHGFSFSMEIGPGTEHCFNDNPYALNGNCIFLHGLSFCTSGNQDFPLFEQMLNKATTGVYSLVDNGFRSITPFDCPEIYCHPLPEEKKGKGNPVHNGVPAWRGSGKESHHKGSSLPAPRT